jgi:NAD(P)-dependent dehydrogenase (short-subunit alcohol dehydrogenase family)
MSLDFDKLFGLKGRIALITGASSGIGLHIAGLYAQAGAAVVLTARRTDLIEASAAQLREAGHLAVAVSLDVTCEETIAPAFDAVEKAMGRAPDIVVNNAGIGMVKRFLDQSAAEVGSVLDTNLKGAYLVGQEAARRMSGLGGGTILNIASISGLRTAGWMSSYAASKAGLIQLSGVMALELAARNIRVNTLCPGNIDTGMQADLKEFAATLIKRTPLRRHGLPQDLDGALLLLVSDAGRYMTGAVVTVDGGNTLSWM